MIDNLPIYRVFFNTFNTFNKSPAGMKMRALAS